MARLLIIAFLLISFNSYAGEYDDIFPDNDIIFKRQEYADNLQNILQKRLKSNVSVSLFGTSLEHLIIFTPRCYVFKYYSLLDAYKFGILSCVCKNNLYRTNVRTK